MPKSRFTLWQRLKHFLTPSQDPSAITPVTDAPATPAAPPPLPSLKIDASSDATGISHETIEGLLNELGYQFVAHGKRQAQSDDPYHFTMQVADDSHEWGCIVRYFEPQQLLVVYSILPFNVPPTHRADMAAVITHLNYDLIIGNLEMDIGDGEVRFKTALDLEVTGVNPLILSYLINSNFSLLTKLYATLEDTANKAVPSPTLDAAVEELLIAEQSRRFYLMSESRQ